MDCHSNRTMIIKLPISSSKKIPKIRWVREWIPEENAETGKTTYHMKWVRADTLNSPKENLRKPERVEPKPEPPSETLYLCNFEGCNKVFPTEGSYRKHAHIHGERQHACSYPGCGKKFLDSSKLKRHQVVHTGEKNYKCTFEGCGKAFSLDFNLRAHMKIHSQEYYHVCHYPNCTKRYTQECKLKSHIKSAHEKNTLENMMKPKTPKPKALPKPPAYASASSDRTYVCPYEECRKAYIHEYKLSLHLKTQHPEHIPEEKESDEQDVYIAKGGIAKNGSRTKPDIMNESTPSKLSKPKGCMMNNKQEWPRQEIYRVGLQTDDSDDDSEEDEDSDSDGTDEENESE